MIDLSPRWCNTLKITLMGSSLVHPNRNEVALGNHLLNAMGVFWEAAIEASDQLKHSISTDAISPVSRVSNAILD